MSKVRELHRKAMSLLDEANVARMRGDSEQSRALWRLAFETEREAAELLTDGREKEPTRSILFRSAATLALDCGEYSEAERLSSVGLAGNPPEAIAQELRAVQTQAHAQVNAAPIPTSVSV